jgi:hypothetical protein
LTIRKLKFLNIAAVTPVLIPYGAARNFSRPYPGPAPHSAWDETRTVQTHVCCCPRCDRPLLFRKVWYTWVSKLFPVLFGLRGNSLRVSLPGKRAPFSDRIPTNLHRAWNIGVLKQFPVPFGSPGNSSRVSLPGKRAPFSDQIPTNLHKVWNIGVLKQFPVLFGLSKNSSRVSLRRPVRKVWNTEAKPQQIFSGSCRANRFSWDGSSCLPDLEAPTAGIEQGHCPWFPQRLEPARLSSMASDRVFCLYALF